VVVCAAFGLGFGGLLLGGRLGDLYGRGRLLVAGLALFVAGPPVAGLASAAGPPVAARTVQGVGAALAVPATLALIGTMYPPGEGPDPGPGGAGRDDQRRRRQRGPAGRPGH
jgi:MFS family permease